MTETTTAVESWTLTLPDDEAKCLRKDCDRAAEWRGVQSCCPCSTNICDPHREAWLAQLAAMGYFYKCGKCHAVGFTVKWWRI